MFRVPFIILNVLTLIALGLACAAAYIDPRTFWQFSFLGLVFPLILLVNVALLFSFIISKNRFGLLTLIAIVGCWPFIQTSFAVHYFDEQQTGGLKLMTWNVKDFDLYNWQHNSNSRQQMLQLIKEEAPDILCLQEFYTADSSHFDNIAYLRDSLGYRYFVFDSLAGRSSKLKSKRYIGMYGRDSVCHEFGIATFSKHEIVTYNRIDFRNARNNDCLITDLRIAGEVVRVFNVHFQSIHLNENDHLTLQEIEEEKQTDWLSLKILLRKMKTAYEKRAEQANLVADAMRAYNGRKILCGDFNDAPVSFTYQTVSEQMQDAFVTRGKGFGRTFSNRIGFFRIDYALFDKQFRIHTCRTIERELSDHYPVISTFSVH